MALDALQEQYNILICKSAGNCKNFISHRPKGRIHEGADSVLSLVVGSMAQEKGPYDFADIDNPSPFTRVGPGPEFIIKPEVAHYGGNAGVDNHGQLTTSGVKSFSTSGATIRNCGTSFSTPRIAALATGLYQELDESFDPLLIKGLIIHSAIYPHNLQTPEIERANQIGFGIPQSIRNILYNDPYVPYKIGKLQIQGFSEPATPKNKITELSHYAEGRPVKTTGGLFAWKARKEAEIF